MSEERRAAWDASQLLPRSDVAKNAVLVADLKWNDAEDELVPALLRAHLSALAFKQRFPGSASVQGRSESVRLLSVIVAREAGDGAGEPQLDQRVRQYRLKADSKLLSDEAGVTNADSVSAVAIYDAAVRKFFEGRLNSDANMRRIAQRSADIHIVLDEVVAHLSSAITAYQEHAVELRRQQDVPGSTSGEKTALFGQERQVLSVIDQIAGLARGMEQPLFDNDQIAEIAGNNQFTSLERLEPPPGTPQQVPRLPKLEPAPLLPQPQPQPQPQPLPSPGAERVPQGRRDAWFSALDQLVTASVDRARFDVDVKLVPQALGRLYRVAGVQALGTIADEAQQRVRDASFRTSEDGGAVALMLRAMQVALDGYRKLGKQRPKDSSDQSRALVRAVHGALAIEYRTAWEYFDSGAVYPRDELYSDEDRRYLVANWLTEDPSGKGLNVSKLQAWRDLTRATYAGGVRIKEEGT